MDLTKGLRPSEYRYVEIALKTWDGDRFMQEVPIAVLGAGFPPRMMNVTSQTGELVSPEDNKTTPCMTPIRIQGFATEEEINGMLTVLNGHADVCAVENVETIIAYDLNDQQYMDLLSDHADEILEDLIEAYSADGECEKDDDLYIRDFVKNNRVMCVGRYYKPDAPNAPDYLWLRTFIRSVRRLGLITDEPTRPDDSEHSWLRNLRSNFGRLGRYDRGCKPITAETLGFNNDTSNGKDGVCRNNV